MSFTNLSPWDAFRWFDTPRETTYNTGAMTPQLIAPKEIRRVALLIATVSTPSSVTISTKPGIPTNAGWIITAGFPFILTHADVGPLVQGEFWAIINSAANGLTVVEILLRDWPQLYEAAMDEVANAFTG